MSFHNQYSYEPLVRGDNEIRLIQLQRSTSELLSGKVIHVPLSANPELCYWALSYCWGSLVRNKTIKLDEKELSITDNLHDALLELRNQDYGLLWVDAICINQEDQSEKSREVQRMRDIYSQACGVAIWLGVGFKTSDKVMNFLQVLATKEPSFLYEEYMEDLPTKNKNSVNLGDEWIALKNFILNDYWSRVWVIQELLLCKGEKKIHCGTSSLPFDTFGNLFTKENDFIKIIYCVVYVLGIDQGGDFHDVANCVSNLLLLRRSPAGLQRISVSDILRVTNNFQATDPRDKVYGILGLNKRLRKLVPHPNYGDPGHVVFRDLTRRMLVEDCNLALICLKIPTHVNQSGVPTWVPNLNDRELWQYTPRWVTEAIPFRSGVAYSTGGGMKPVIIFDGPILRVRGLFYGSVVGLSRTNESGLDPSSKGAAEPVYGPNVYGSDEDTVKALEQCTQAVLSDARLRQTLDIESIRRLYGRTCLDSDKLERIFEFSFGGRSLPQWLKLEYTDRQASSSLIDRTDPTLACLNTHAVNRWRWFSTDLGYIGRTHPQTQQGDKIFIALGSNLPLMLRPCHPDHPDHPVYQVVGAAYVQGIMHGEALEGVPDDQMQIVNLV